MKTEPPPPVAVHKRAFFVREGSGIGSGPHFIVEADPRELRSHLPAAVYCTLKTDEDDPHRYFRTAWIVPLRGSRLGRPDRTWAMFQAGYATALSCRSYR